MCCMTTDRKTTRESRERTAHKIVDALPDGYRATRADSAWLCLGIRRTDAAKFHALIDLRTHQVATDDEELADELAERGISLKGGK